MRRPFVETSHLPWCQRRPRKERMAMTMTTAPTIQMMLFMVLSCSHHLTWNARESSVERCNPASPVDLAVGVPKHVGAVAPDVREVAGGEAFDLGDEGAEAAAPLKTVVKVGNERG